MKKYEVHRVMREFTQNSSEELRRETEELMNEKARDGYRVISVDFEQPLNSDFIYAFVVFEKK